MQRSRQKGRNKSAARAARKAAPREPVHAALAELTGLTALMVLHRVVREHKWLARRSRWRVERGKTHRSGASIARAWRAQWWGWIEPLRLSASRRATAPGLVVGLAPT